MSESGPGTRSTLFLDTNTLHYARIFIGLAKRESLPQFGQLPAEGSVDAAIKMLVGGHKTQDNTIQGRKIVDYLSNQTNAGTDILYSPVSQFELTYGQLRGQAIQDAAKEGIPFRMWSRLDEHEISHRLTVQAHQTIRQEVGDLEAIFQDAGILLSTPDPRRMMPVWALVQEIMTYVFLDLGDCTVYAHALLAEASELITADVYFGDVVAGIENPGAAAGGKVARSRFTSAKYDLKTALAREIGVSRGQIQLPKAHRVNKL